MLETPNPDLTIRYDERTGGMYVRVPVVKQGTKIVTTYATPRESFSGNSILLKYLPQTKDSGIIVPEGEKIYTVKKGYVVKEVIATGFNHKADSFTVQPGDRIYVSSDAPALRYVFERGEEEVPTTAHTELVTMIAGPKEAVAGSGVVSRKMETDAAGMITVPYGGNVFRAKANYSLQKVTATGFNGKQEAFQVKPGSKLKVTSRGAVLKYDYVYRTEDVVTMTIGSRVLVINNQEFTIDTPAFISKNRTYIPFRALAEAFEATVVYNENNRTVTAELDGTKVVMTIGSRYYTVNGVKHQMDVAPFITNSRTVIPVRFIAEAFGISVTPIYNDDQTTSQVVFVG